MVGDGIHPAGHGTVHGATRQGSQTSWVEELEALRDALTQDEFESAKRHLLAG